MPLPVELVEDGSPREVVDRRKRHESASSRGRSGLRRVSSTQTASGAPRASGTLRGEPGLPLGVRQRRRVAERRTARDGRRQRGRAAGDRIDREGAEVDHDLRGHGRARPAAPRRHDQQHGAPPTGERQARSRERRDALAGHGASPRPGRPRRAWPATRSRGDRGDASTERLVVEPRAAVRVISSPPRMPRAPSGAVRAPATGAT